MAALITTLSAGRRDGSGCSGARHSGQCAPPLLLLAAAAWSDRRTQAWQNVWPHRRVVGHRKICKHTVHSNVDALGSKALSAM